MAKTISVYRCKPNLVDLNLVSRPDTKEYIFGYATNFDAVFADIETVPKDGLRSKTAFDSGPAEGFRGKTRFVLAPSDYGIDDTKQMWFRIKPVATDGTVGAPEAIHLVMPSNPQGRKAVVLAGTAPAGASLANSLEINLQYQVQGVELQNNDVANDLYVAFEPGGPEYVVKPLSTSFTNLSLVSPTFSQIFVRGSGGPVAFQMISAARNEMI